MPTRASTRPSAQNLGDTNAVLAAAVSSLPLVELGPWWAKVVVFHQADHRTPYRTGWGSHPHIELSVVRQGGQIYETRKGPEERHAGDWVLMPPGCRHERRHERGRARLAGFFIDLFPRGGEGQSLLRRFILSAESQGYGGPCPPEISVVLAAIDRESADALPFGEQRLRRLLADLLTLLVRHIGASEFRAAASGRLRPGSRHQPLFELGQAYIAAHLAEPLPVSRLAQELGLSERSLNNLFHGQVGQSCAAFITEQRLDRALAMLQGDPRLKVMEVARRCGYEDPLYFTKVCKKRYGLSPVALREGRASLL